MHSLSHSLYKLLYVLILLPALCWSGQLSSTQSASSSSAATTLSSSSNAPQIQLLKNFQLGAQGTGLSPYWTSFRTWNQKLLIAAQSMTMGAELWSFDGSPGGFSQLEDTLFQMSSSSWNSVEFGGKFYYTAGGMQGRSLWVSDGTVLGTQKIWESNSTSSQISNLTVSGNKLFFTAVDTSKGTELAVFDGQNVEILDLWPNRDQNGYPQSSYPMELSSLGNGSIVFKARSQTFSNAELWTSDGTSSGTQVLHSFTADTTNGGDPTKLYALNSGWWALVANNAAGQRVLWKTNLSQFDSMMVLSQNMQTYNAFSFAQKMVLSGDTGSQGITQWWAFDGQNLNPLIQSDVSGSTTSDQSLVWQESNLLLYWAKNAAGLYHLYSMNGSGTTQLVLQTNAQGDSRPQDWNMEKAQKDASGHFWIRANNGVRTQLYELWNNGSQWLSKDMIQASDTLYRLGSKLALLGNRKIFTCTDSTQRTMLCALNSKPNWSQNLSPVFSYNAPTGFRLGEFHAQDPDGDALVYKVSDSTWFQIVEDTLLVKNQSQRGPGNYALQMIARDAWGAESFSPLNVQLRENQSPSFIVNTDTIVVWEGDSLQIRPNWFANPSAGPFYESWQKVGFVSRFDAGASWMGFGPADSLMSVLPSLDSTTGTLKFKFKAGVYNPGSSTFEFLASLRDNGGTQYGGVDSTQWYRLVFRVQNRNQAPYFSGVFRDTITSLRSGFAENLSQWLGPIAVGDSFEQRDTNQKIQSVQIVPFDSSVFAQLPFYDLVNNQLSFALKPNVAGVFPAKLILRDNGGTQNGGVDSLVRIVYFNAPLLPNQAPSFDADTGVIRIWRNSGMQNIPTWARNIQAGSSVENSQLLRFEIKPKDSLFFAQMGGSKAFSQLPHIDSVTGVLSFALNNNFYTRPQQNFEFDVVLRDNGGTQAGGVDRSSPKSLRIGVDLVNLPPQIDSLRPDTFYTYAGASQNMPWLGQLRIGDSIEEWMGDQQLMQVRIRGIDSNLFQAYPQYDFNAKALNFAMKPQVQAGLYRAEVYLQDNGGTAGGGTDSLVRPVYFRVQSPLIQAPQFMLSRDQIVLNEDEGPQRIAQFAQNIQLVNGNSNSAHFELRPVDTVSLGFLGGEAALFKQRPHIDSVSGDLEFEFNPDVYTYLGRSFDLKVQLVENASQGILVSQMQGFRFVVNGINDAPVLLSKTVLDTLKSVQPGQFEKLSNWLPRVSVGDAFEQKDLNQGSVNYQIRALDTSKFVAQPFVDASTQTVNFKLIPNFSGTIPMELKLRDQGGVALGGVDSLVLPFVLWAPRTGVNPLPVLPSFAGDEVPYIRISSDWQWTTDTTQKTVQEGAGQIYWIQSEQPLYVRNWADRELSPSAWRTLSRQGGFEWKAEAWSEGLALGLRMGNSGAIDLRNAEIEVELRDSVGGILRTEISSHSTWAYPFAPAGAYKLSARLKVEDSTLAQFDSSLKVNATVLKKTLVPMAGASNWVMYSMGTQLADTGIWYHWDPEAESNPIDLRYRAYQVGTTVQPTWSAWGLIKKNTVLDYSSRYPTDELDLSLSSANEGWNQVANPYPFYLGDESVEGGDSLRCWQWDRSKSDYVELDGGPGPFEACWIFSPVDRVLRFKPIPGPAPKSTPSAARKGLHRNQVVLSLAAGNYRDSGHILALSARDSILPSIPTVSEGRLQMQIQSGMRSLRSQWKADSNGIWTISYASGVSGLSKGQIHVDGLADLEEGWGLFVRKSQTTWQQVEQSLDVSLSQESSTMEFRFARVSEQKLLDQLSLQFNGQQFWFPLQEVHGLNLLVHRLDGTLVKRSTYAEVLNLPLDAGAYVLSLESRSGQQGQGKIFFVK